MDENDKLLILRITLIQNCGGGGRVAFTVYFCWNCMNYLCLFIVLIAQRPDCHTFIFYFPFGFCVFNPTVPFFLEGDLFLFCVVVILKT